MRVIVRHRLVRARPDESADEEPMVAVVMENEFLAPTSRPVAAGKSQSFLIDECAQPVLHEEPVVFLAQPFAPERAEIIDERFERGMNGVVHTGPFLGRAGKSSPSPAPITGIGPLFADMLVDSAPGLQGLPIGRAVAGLQG